GQVLVEQRRQRTDAEPAGGRVAAGDRQLELQLVEPVGAPDVAQPGAAGERAEWGLDRQPQPVDEDVVHADDGRVVADLVVQGPTQLAGEVGCGEVGDLQDVVDDGADAGATGQRSQRQRHR